MALSAGLNPQALLKRALNTKFRNPFSRRTGYLVLDIGSSSVKLAEVMQRAAETPGLWDELRTGIPSLRSLDERMKTLRQYYTDLLAGSKATAIRAESAAAVHGA